jgi:hypothetical protein
LVRVYSSSFEPEPKMRKVTEAMNSLRTRR